MYKWTILLTVFMSFATLSIANTAGAPDVNEVDFMAIWKQNLSTSDPYDGIWDVTAGNVDPPRWMPGKIMVYNTPKVDSSKKLWIWVSYTDQIAWDYSLLHPEELVLHPGNSNSHTPIELISNWEDGQTFTRGWYFSVPRRPDRELIALDQTTYQIWNEHRGVDSVSIASSCVPEPSSLAVITTGLAGLVLYAVRRYKS